MPAPILSAPAFQARNRIVYLTGFMGSGKSTIGPIVANSLGFDFVDIDKAIERSVGKSVNTIFLESGEDHFRTLERALITEITTRQRLVVSLGGGTFVDEVNFRVIRSTGIVVYLKSSPEQIYKWVYHRDDRPVLKDAKGERLTDEQLRKRVDDLYKLREPVYALADFTIVTDEKRVGVTVDEVVCILAPIVE